MNARIIAIFLCVAASGCSGTSGSSTAPRPAPAVPSVNSQLVPTSFDIATPRSGASVGRLPRYLGSGAQSVEITLTAVNGATPPMGLVTTVVSTISPASCPCTVAGPLVPQGDDAFTLTTFDGVNASGNQLATYSGTFTIVNGSPNSGNIVTLAGIPKSLVIGTLPAAAAGSPFATAMPFTVTASDADGMPITGVYATPLTVTDSDASGAQGSHLLLNGAGLGSTIVLSASSDVAAISYGGLAIAPATISAAARGASGATATFAPSLSPIAYLGPTNTASAPELDLYALTGTGSSATFSASEIGWTNTPYDRPLTAVAGPACATIGTVAPGSGTSFTFTVVGSPVAGSCTITIADGAGQTRVVTGTYTTSGFGLQ